MRGIGGLWMAKGFVTGKGSMLASFGLSSSMKSSLVPRKSATVMMNAGRHGSANRLFGSLFGGGEGRGMTNGGQDRRTPLSLSR